MSVSALVSTTRFTAATFKKAHALALTDLEDVIVAQCKTGDCVAGGRRKVHTIRGVNEGAATQPQFTPHASLCLNNTPFLSIARDHLLDKP